jgi:hypothetical protein
LPGFFFALAAFAGAFFAGFLVLFALAMFFLVDVD